MNTFSYLNWTWYVEEKGVTIIVIPLAYILVPSCNMHARHRMNPFNIISAPLTRACESCQELVHNKNDAKI